MFLQPANEYNSFIVDDRPGEQWISLKRKYGDNEDITIKATMFDGVIPLSSAVDADASGATQLHITIFVSISKGEGSDMLEFVCSALPNGIIILRLCTRSSKMMSPQVHLGPKFRYDYLFCTYRLYLLLAFSFFRLVVSAHVDRICIKCHAIFFS